MGNSECGRENEEGGMGNAEGGLQIGDCKCILFILKKIERSDSILRHSAVRYSTFCGSLFN
jgi:hypothetical protein